MKRTISTMAVTLIIAAAILAGSLGLGLKASPAVSNLGLNASADNGVMAASDTHIDYTRDKFINGTSHPNNDLYQATPWNNRIEVKLHLGGDSFIYVNLDTRRMPGFKEDILVEYRSYYLSGTREINQNIKSFYVDITFTSDYDVKAYASCSSTNRSSQGFTRSTTFWHNSRTDLWLTVVTTGGNTRTAKFEFFN